MYEQYITNNLNEVYMSSYKKKLLAFDHVLETLGGGTLLEPKAMDIDYLKSDDAKNKLRKLIPTLRQCFSIQAIPNLSEYSWNKNKNPVVNLLKQITNDLGFTLIYKNFYEKLESVVDENGKEQKKKVHRKFYFINTFVIYDEIKQILDEDE